MIFVTVGTTQFDDLVRRMDQLAPSLDDEVLCQIARGTYLPTHCRYFRFASDLEPYLRQARLVVGHGGLGTVMESVRLHKPFVGLSNPDRPDLHQAEILRECETRNYIVWCKTLDDLPESLERAASRSFAVYSEPPCRIPDVIEQYLRTRSTTRLVGRKAGVRS